MKKNNNFIIFVFFTLFIYSLFVYVYYQKSHQNAIQQAILSTQDFLRNIEAAQTYFSEDQKKRLLKYHEKGLLDEEMFVPELYSCTYAAKKINQYYNEIRAKEGLSSISLQYIAKNPKNINNQATSEEIELLDRFQRGDITFYKKVFINDLGKETLYYAKAGKPLTKSCLNCHGDPHSAPLAIINEYGPAKGFFGQEGEIRAFSKVLMPLEPFIQIERNVFQTRTVASFLSLLIIFILTFIFLRKEQKEANKFQKVIDTLNEIVIIKTKEEVLSTNRSFLKFFNVNDIKEFQKKYSCVSQVFQTEDESLKIDLNNIDDALIHQLDSLDKSKRIVSMKDGKGELKKLTIKIHKLNETQYVIVFSDITQIKNRADMLEQKANLDSLTGAYSREKFNELYEIEFRRSQRYINSLSLLFLDIDHFKEINDTYGHDLGDQALIQFVKIIQENIRQYDVLARWGGEEFILMLPQTDMSAAFKIAEKLRKQISNHTFETIGTITCSIGVSMLQKNDDIHSLIKRADNALYKAKRSGRNRSIIDF